MVAACGAGGACRTDAVFRGSQKCVPTAARVIGDGWRQVVPLADSPKERALCASMKRGLSRANGPQACGQSGIFNPRNLVEK
jgi:hypothetical protein